MAVTYPTLTYAPELEHIVQQELEQLISLLTGYLSQQHKEDGSHSAITADSVTVTGAVVQSGTSQNTFGGDLIALLGSGNECGIGTLASVNGAALLTSEITRQGLLLGGVTNGMFAEWRTAQSPMDSSTKELCIWNLKFSTTKPVWRLGILGSAPTLIDGGTGSTKIWLGDTSRPLAGVITDDIYAGNGLHERGRTPAVGEFTVFSPTRTALAGTWTGGTITTAQYSLVGKTVTMLIEVESSSNSLGTAILNIAIPGGMVANKEIRNYCVLNDGVGSTFAHGQIIVGAGGTSILFVKSDGSSFAANAGTLFVRGEITFEVQ